jgi:HAD superfamily hydrolase (TIGR01509 family)
MAMSDWSPASFIQLVVFDLGRVLVRICNDWRHACERAGLQLSTREPDAQTKLRLLESFHLAEVGGIGLAELAEEAGPLMGLSSADVRAMSDAFIFGPYPGAADLLAELSAAGIPTACLSNTNEHHWELLSQRGHRAWLPMDRLNHRFASHLIRARKPDDAIYAHVERETGVPGPAILFFDDVPENVHAAEKRGWNVQCIDPALDEPIGQIRSALRRHKVFG